MNLKQLKLVTRAALPSLFNAALSDQLTWSIQSLHESNSLDDFDETFDIGLSTRERCSDTRLCL
jgi:hypothetical protein